MISLSPLEIAYCAVVLVVSYALRGSTGFGGFAAMPLMALVVPMKILVPVWTLLTIVSSTAIVGSDRPNVCVPDLLRMAPGCIVGIAIGLYFFKTLDAQMLARAFGAIVLVYAVYSLWAMRRAPPRWQLDSRAIAAIAGTLGGVFGTVFGTMASIFFAVYLDAQRAAKDHFRATISAMLLILSVVRGIGYYAVGEFDLETLILFAAAFVPMLIGIFIGDRIHARLDQNNFKRLVCGILIVSAISLLAK